ncbi:paraquat-inducible protein A [Enterovibrio nigricans]|uniref:Paraquat-inducible protein A n=1 Tax=Enterovibrio nigricans DSM 22720 TaxID=1121868 RepID=A0A1T4W5Z2_9GAMM|nr:paraquat-inducible protein A [Enterovibrio nigricans]SKA72455.1 paraquat-inducible protein A [Enterovibrio nigricans DSM 22720]
MNKPEHHLIACHECGLVSVIPDLENGNKASCPRCSHTLVRRVANCTAKVTAIGMSCLVMLLLSCSFPFMSFSASGLSHQISLIDALQVIRHFDNNALAALLLSTVIFLPALYIVVVVYLFRLAEKKSQGKRVITSFSVVKRLCRLVFRVEIWLLVDIFLIGVIVSLVKIAALADVELGAGFWSYSIYSALVVVFSRAIDKAWLWDNLLSYCSTGNVKSGDTHLSNNHVACSLCHQINPYDLEWTPSYCCRCDAKLHHYDPHANDSWAWSFLISAIIFYFPANLYPMMYTVSLGSVERSTIMDGVILLWQFGSYPVAAVIFIASIFVPMTKMFIMIWLLRSSNASQYEDDASALKKLKYYRFTELVGRWSMIDVFVVALLSALVNLKGIMSISPGPAALYFAIVVFFTMCAALVFDPRTFWGPYEKPMHHDDQRLIVQTV